ncbi:MAG TPA: gamma-glutamyltransferase [Solirubrobacterales bacterium]|nr:gamma-glutamyltransferase [Solirubrobacterales bacterium]
MTAVAVAAPHRLAVAAAEEAVAEGGNALDAALAAAALLVVAYPHQCALGGDLTALVRDADGEVTAVLSLGAAPAAVDVRALRAPSVRSLSRPAVGTANGAARMPKQGALTVTVPGVVAGWRELAGLGATLGLRAPLLRAAAAAADGVEVVPGLARAIVERGDAVSADPGLRAVFTDADGPLAAGTMLRQPQLAATLEALAHDPAQMYEGEIAAALVAFLRDGGSAMTTADFAAHRAERPEPLVRAEGDLRWWAAPPPSQGATLLALLGETEVPLARARAAQAARTRLLGDPRGGEIDLEGMLDPLAAPAGAAPPRGAGDTVAITAVDDEGRSVALIQSVFQIFGAGLLEPRTGIVLHNRGSHFSLEPGHPAEIAGGRRPPHTLCPVLGERLPTASGDAAAGPAGAEAPAGPAPAPIAPASAPTVRAAIGCQGGSAQPLILSQVVAEALDPDASLDAALAAPRWVVGDRELGFDAETVLAEPGAESRLQPELAAAGAPPLVIGAAREDRCGHVQIARALAAGRLEAAADPRADGIGLVTQSREESA